ncbi:hypothetical protein ANASTE_00550 [Anaerofustis stercorihominis DSM 17244]|uniref:Uncharacterized protein n=1 Tax=Anaerofustis stercorihominis DSM 17244 TaxID=445971 RepID=B1C752_9FIRM|nr:hypothetical protein ANASTE_00550 [Anaerofustis stercorihominis DSM 17244]
MLPDDLFCTSLIYLSLQLQKSKTIISVNKQKKEYHDLDILSGKFFLSYLNNLFVIN